MTTIRNQIPNQFLFFRKIPILNQTRGPTLRNLLKGNFKGYCKTPTAKQQRQAQTANCQSSTGNHQPQTAKRKSPNANRQTQNANHQTQTANRQTQTTKRKPPTAKRKPRKPPTAQTAHCANRQPRKRQPRKPPTAQTANCANRQSRKPPTAQTANRANRQPRKPIESQLIGSQMHNKFERNRPSRSWDTDVGCASAHVQTAMWNVTHDMWKPSNQ